MIVHEAKTLACEDLGWDLVGTDGARRRKFSEVITREVT